MSKNYENVTPYMDGWQNKSGELGFLMSNDYLFRILLQRDELTLKSIISAFLQISCDKIREVEVLNPIEIGRGIDEKEFHLDVRTIVEDGGNGIILPSYGGKLEMDFEMQNIRYDNWTGRTTAYAARSFDSLKHGEDYDRVNAVWQISFCDFALDDDHPEFCANYSLINERDLTLCYTDRIRITSVNMGRTDLATCEDVENGRVKWARFFKAGRWEELMLLAENDEQIKQAVSSVWQYTEDDRIRDEIRHRKDNVREYNWLVREAEKGRAAVKEVEERVAQAKAQAEAQAEARVEQAKAQAETRVAQVKAQAEARAEKAEKENAALTAEIAELKKQLEKMRSEK